MQLHLFLTMGFFCTGFEGFFISINIVNTLAFLKHFILHTMHLNLKDQTEFNI